MTKKPIIPALTMLLTLIVLVHATALLVQQETAWWLVMDAACGVISLGLCALSLICRKRGGTKILWKIVLGLIVVQMLTTVALQFVPIEQNRYQLLFWGIHVCHPVRTCERHARKFASVCAAEHEPFDDAPDQNHIRPGNCCADFCRGDADLLW